MLITRQAEKGAAVYAVSGRIDGHTAGDLDAALGAAMSQGERQVVLDMAEVQYIGSAGLRTLVTALARIKARGGDLKLVALSTHLLRAFRIVGFENFFSLHDTLDGAMAGF